MGVCILRAGHGLETGANSAFCVLLHREGRVFSFFLNLNYALHARHDVPISFLMFIYPPLPSSLSACLIKEEEEALCMYICLMQGVK